MRRKNKKIKKNSFFKTGTAGVVSLMLCGFVMLMVYWMFDSRCTAIQREIDKAEKEFKALETECTRETSAWNAMKTPERLNAHLTRFGLEMKLTRPDQIVRMDRDGRPFPGQVAVSRARSRSRAIENMAFKSSVSGAVPVTPTSSRATGRQLPKGRAARR